MTKPMTAESVALPKKTVAWFSMLMDAARISENRSVYFDALKESFSNYADQQTAAKDAEVAELRSRLQSLSSKYTPAMFRIAELERQVKVARDFAEHSHIGYSTENKCWFVRMYGFENEHKARAALAAMQSPKSALPHKQKDNSVTS